MATGGIILVKATNEQKELKKVNEEFIKKWAKRGLILMHEPVQLDGDENTYLTFSTNKKDMRDNPIFDGDSLLFHSVRQLIDNFHRESKKEEGLYGEMNSLRGTLEFTRRKNVDLTTKNFDIKQEKRNLESENKKLMNEKSELMKEKDALEGTFEFTRRKNVELTTENFDIKQEKQS